MASTIAQSRRNIVVADSGGSKAAWGQVLDGKILDKEISTSGLNAFFMDEETIINWVKNELIPQLEDPKVEVLYFYGAGCCHPDNIKKLKIAFGKVWEGAHIEVYSDTLAAARSLCQKEKGIACIIGTGSSTCLYDGENIAEDRSGIGYALGDEASGSYFGKILLKSFIYGMLSEELKRKLHEQFGEVTRDNILENVYKKPFPSRYLGQFTRFYSANRGDAFIEKTLEAGFDEFVNCHITQLPGYKDLKVNFVGSMPIVFKDVLEKVLTKHGVQVGNFQQTPIRGLVQYHCA